jgi:hypothetical protein
MSLIILWWNGEAVVEHQTQFYDAHLCRQTPSIDCCACIGEWKGTYEKAPGLVPVVPNKHLVGIALYYHRCGGGIINKNSVLNRSEEP